ncbi:hypothetical protein D5R93_07800 [Actinomyces lilanjuaniae]|uniref:Uncharacterized protein n=1 Tax=Actinomyces lilanjuaniae TaxID=2321394 RepID=A0ABM6Z3T2_9ACTO|nr:hypothetical protein [Actinomyces lilanjuaniae]AYD89950.1 hypothetical protein D5R93_07800 [Actinomyces lilanjuaniae]
MLTTDTLSQVFTSVSAVMTSNRDYLVRLDQVGGDGDLGVSMDDGFAAVASFLGSSAPTDLGQAFRQGRGSSTRPRRPPWGRSSASASWGWPGPCGD